MYHTVVLRKGERIVASKDVPLMRDSVNLQGQKDEETRACLLLSPSAKASVVIQQIGSSALESTVGMVPYAFLTQGGFH